MSQVEWAVLPERTGEIEPNAFRIYSQLIRSGDTVVVVGPNDSVRSDPTAWLAMFLAGGDGVVSLADPMTGTPLQVAEYDRISKITGPPVMYGNVTRHLIQLRSLSETYRQAGVTTAAVEWLGSMSGALRIPVKHPVRVIIDHDTTAYISKCLRPVTYRTRSAFIKRALRHYFKTLTDSGTLIIQTNLRRHDLTDGPKSFGYVPLVPLLESVGFSVQTLQVRDRYIIPIPEQAASDLHRMRMLSEKESRYTNNLYQYLRHGAQQAFLVFDKTLDHASRDMLICRK